MTTPPQLLTSTSEKWKTPPDLVSEIADFLGGIDLDPCGDPEHNVPAAEHYDGTNGRDGLKLPWYGRVFMNPPYGREMKRWVERFCTEPIDEGIALLKAATDTQWFKPLWQYPICFLEHRVYFLGEDNRTLASSTVPSVLVYRHPNEDEDLARAAARIIQFAEAFEQRGEIRVPFF
jgi:hypothetical protein